MSLSRKMRRAALKQNMKAVANKRSFGQRINNEPQIGQDDSFLANMLGAISSSPFMKKVLMNAIGITLMATTPSFAANIQGAGSTSVSDPTTIGGKNVINITGGNQITEENLMHLFKQFQVGQDDIANFKLEGNTTNVLNFVKTQVNINGIVNTIKNNKVDGNLYFLSPEGVVIGSKGIVNTGSFYAIVPDKKYMEKFINDYDDNPSFKNDISEAALNSLTGLKFGGDEGIIIGSEGQITINGKINATNNIGLYAGKNLSESAKSIIIGSNAVLNTTDPFEAIVNLSEDNTTISVDEAQFVKNEGKIEICSRGDILLGKTEENQVPNEEETKITGKRVAFVADNISDVEGSKVSITAKSSKTEQNELPKDVVIQGGKKVTLNNTALKAESGSVAVLANEGITLGDVTATEAKGANILIGNITKKEFSYGYLSQVSNKIRQLLPEDMLTYLPVYNNFKEKYEKLNNYLDSNELEKAQLVLDEIIELSNNSLGADAPTPESTKIEDYFKPIAPTGDITLKGALTANIEQNDGYDFDAMNSAINSIRIKVYEKTNDTDAIDEHWDHFLSSVTHNDSEEALNYFGEICNCLTSDDLNSINVSSNPNDYIKTITTPNGAINVQNDGGNVILGKKEENQDPLNAIINAGTVSITGNAIVDAENTVNIITANSENNNENVVLELKAKEDDIVINNTTLIAENGTIELVAGKGKVTLAKDITKADSIGIIANKGIDVANITTSGEIGINLINSSGILLSRDLDKLFKDLYDNNSSSDVRDAFFENANALLDLIKTENPDISKANTYIENLNRLAEENGFSSQRLQSVDNYITGTTSGNITINGALSANGMVEQFNEQSHNYETVPVEGVSNVNVRNTGGNVVLNNTTINAGAVTMIGKGIVDSANTTNSITANGISNIDYFSNELIALTATEDDVELANTTLTAAKAGIYVTSQKGAVTLDEVTAGSRDATEQDTGMSTVNVRAHEGITVGDVFASGFEGINLSNNLTVEGENQQVEYATGNIVAGNLTAQEIRKYGDNQQEVYKQRIAINNTNSYDVYGNGALQDENRNVILNNVTGGEVFVNALGEVSTAVEQNNAKTIEGNYLNINANSIDVEKIKGNQANLNADTLVKATDINIESGLNIGEMTPVDSVQIGSIQAGSVSINTNQGATYGNITTTGGEQSGITLRNVGKKVYNEETQDYDTTEATGDITINGALSANGVKEQYNEQSQNFETVTVEGVSNITVQNDGGNIVLGEEAKNNQEAKNATINAGTVSMIGKGIVEAEGSENIITANNEYNYNLNFEITQENDKVITLKASENNVNLANTTLTANKGGIFVTASKGSVTLDEVTAGFREGSNQETYNSNVKVQAHAGIIVGDVFASGFQGITLSNNLTVEGENQQTINATGNIEAGNLTAQEIRNYEQDQQEINNHDIFINNTNSEDNHLYGALPNENRNVTINNLTGSNVTINALGKVATAVKQNETETETNILNGYQLNINANSVDVDEIESEYATINADDNVKANNIKLNSSLYIGEMAPVNTVDIDTIEASSVEINTNQGATYGNITTTGGEQSGITLRNVGKKVYNEETQDYDTTEATGDITINGALSANGVKEQYNEQSQNYENVTVEGVGNVLVQNAGGNVKLDNATINAGAVTMTGKGIVDEANTTNTITANGNGNNNNENSNAVIALTATEDDVELANTALTAAKAGIYVTAQKGSVTLDEVTAGSKEATEQDSSRSTVNVQAHAGITVGDVFASGNQGINLSNNLTVEGENHQTLYATGNIVAGDLTAQEIRKYGDNQQEVLKKRITINNTNSAFVNGFLQDEDRNVTLNNVTGLIVTINALGEVSTAVEQNNAKTIEGDLLQIKANSIDVENIKGKQANLNADTLVKATDIDLTSNLNIGSEMTPVDTVEIGSIQAGSVSINTNQGATYGNITTTGGEKRGINLCNVNKEVKVSEQEWATTEAEGDIVINGALSANYGKEGNEGFQVGVGNVTVQNAGGNIVLNDATINAGTVAMTAKGIEDVESTTNSITANNSGDSMYPVMTLTATDGDIALSNTTLNATKGGLFATAENASVKITKDMEADSVEISAHSGIEVGDITATGDNGITLSNTLSVENQQTPEEATGDITAGKLTAQYEMDQQTYGGMIQIINKSEQEMISEQSQTSTEDERNIFLSDVTGGEITIEGDNLISTGKIEGEHISVYSYKADFNELEGNDFYFGVGELNANSIKAKSEYGLNVGYYKQPVFKADIGSIEATSVNINTNEGVTIGNITITENSDESGDLQNKISINNVSVYDFEKCNDNYNAILNVLSLDDAEAVSSEYGSSFNSAVISGNIEEALEALDGALQMAKGKGATLTGISVDSADYIIKEAENDITIKGAFQLATSNDDSDAHSSMIAEESKFNVKVLNQGGDIKLDGATIDAGTVTMTAENIIDTEDSDNIIKANQPEQSDSSSSDNESINALELTATEGDISLGNTVITSNGDSLISAVSGDVKVDQDITSGNDLSINAVNAEVNNVEVGNKLNISLSERLTSFGKIESKKDLFIESKNADMNNVQAGNNMNFWINESITSSGDIVADGKVDIKAGDITTANGIYGENVTLDGDSLALGDVVAINEVEINANENISADNIAGNNVLMEATTVDKIATVYSESELNITAEKINNIEEIKAPSVEITTTKGMKLGDVEVLSESGSFVAKNLEGIDEQSVDENTNNNSEEAGNNIEINSVIIDKSDSEPTNEPNSSQLVLGTLGTLELEGEGTEVSEEEGNIKIINEIGDVKVNETLTAKNVDVSAYGSMDGSAVINAEEKVTIDAGENVEVAEINAENVEISAGGDVEAGQVNADNVSVIAENNIGIDSIEGKEVTLDAGGDMELAEVSAEKVEAFAGGNLGANGIEGKEVTLSAGENVNVAEVTGDEVAVNAGSNMIVGNISGNKVLLTAKGDIEAESFDVGEKLTVEAENVNIGEAVAEGLIDLTANGELEAESLVTGDEMVAMATNANIGEAVAGNYMQIGVIGNLTAENLESSGDMDITADRIKLGNVEAGENLTITSIPINQFVENVVADVSNTDTSNESDADLVAENLKAGKYLIVSAEKAEIGNTEGSFVKIGALDGIEVDTVTAKASGDDKYDAVIYNAETGDINVNNVKVENGNVKVVNMAEDGNVAMKDVTAGNIYATSMNDLTVDSAKATSENNNSVEDAPYTSGLYLEGQKVTVNSAESASDYMKIEGGYVELLDKDGKLSKIYKENPVLEEGVDVYRFADDVVDVPETMTDTLENLVEAGKIILCTKEEPTPEPQPDTDIPDDVIEEAKATIKTQDDNNTAQGQNNENLDIQLNLNANIDLGGQRDEVQLDLTGGSEEERLQITMGSDGTIELMPKEQNQVVNEDDQTGDNVNIDGNSNDNGEDLDNGENLANGQLVANDENLGNNEDNEDNGVVENLENNEDGDENSGNNLRRNRRNNRRNRNNRGNRGNRGHGVDRLNRVNTTTLLNKLG